MALGKIALGNVAPADIAKIMRARKAMRPHYEAYIQRKILKYNIKY